MSEHQLFNNSAHTNRTDNQVEIEDLNFRYGFTVGLYGFLIPEGIESEVINSPKVYPIPNTSSLMSGLISIRGHFSPVFAIDQLLGIQFNNRSQSIIVLKLHGSYLAFHYDKATSLELHSQSSTESGLLPEPLQRFAGNIYKIDHELWFEFDFKTCMDQLSINIVH